MNNIVVGKRVQVGAALTSTALVLGRFWPEYLEMFVAGAVPVTFVVQLIIVRYFGITK